MNVEEFENFEDVLALVSYAEIVYDKQNLRHAKRKRELYYNLNGVLVFNWETEEYYDMCVNYLNQFFESERNGISEHVKRLFQSRMLEYVGGDHRLMHTLYDFMHNTASTINVRV